jgi:DNA uptake protein ComE-like DNA-binding protein
MFYLKQLLVKAIVITLLLIINTQAYAADSAPVVSNFTASSNSSGTVTGSISVSHATSSLSQLRIHYCNSSSYNCGNQFVDLTKSTGTRSFSFDASQYAGQTVYYKAEVTSSAGTQTSPTPNGTVNIPSADSAPVVSNFTASSNSSGTVTGSISVSHATSSLSQLRIHYCNSSSYNCGTQYVDLIKTTGTKSFSFGVSQYAGQTVYYKAEVKSNAGTQTLPAPNGTVSIPSTDSAPVVSNFSASSNSSGTVTGSITVSHATTSLSQLRIHYCNSNSYNCGNQYVDLTKSTGTRSFNFDASQYAGQTVYYKAEVTSSAGTQTSPTPNGTVNIPSADTAPVVSNFTASSNSSGTVTGSISVSHATSSLSQLRIHYCNSSSYNCGNQFVDLTKSTGTKSFSFGASQYAGQTVYYKAEVISNAGTKTLPLPNGTVLIPSADLAPVVSNFTASSNSSGTVTGSISVSHATSSLSELRIHYCNSSSYNCGTQYVDLIKTTGTKSFSFGASQYAGQTVYYKAEVTSSAGTQTSPTPNGTVNIPSADSAPVVSNFTASSNSSGTVTGSISVSHATSSLSQLRIHYCNSSSYNCGNQFVDLTKSTGTKSFSFGASQYAGQTVYYKAEVKSNAGTQTLPVPSGTVVIPAENDTAPVVTNLSASSNDSGMVNGSFSASHSSNKVKNVRIHYADNANYTNSQSVDIGSYNAEQSTGNKTFSFDASAWAGQTVYYKLEVKSPSGTQTLPAPDGTVAIPAENDTAPVVTSLSASSNDSGLVNGSFSASHSSNKVKNVRIHYADNANYTNSQSVDIGSYNAEQSTGNKTFSFDASAWAGQTVYYKLEVKSPSGTQTLPAPDGTVAIPAENDTAPVVTSLSASSNDSGLVNGSFSVSHSSNKVKNVRVHYADNANYTNSQSVDIGSYSAEQSTGSKTFSFDASAWAGQTVYYKLEVKSPSGTQTSPAPDGTVAISAINQPVEIKYARLSQSSDATKLTVEFQVLDPENKNINVEVFLSSGGDVNNDFKTSSKKSLKSIQNGKHTVIYTSSDIESYGFNNSQTIIAKVIAYDNENLTTSRNTNIVNLGNSNSYCAEWVEDLTFDDTNGNIPQVEKSSSFIKGWRIKNCGSIQWTDNIQLVYNWGSIQLIEKITVNQTEVGQSVDIYATLQSPDELGKYDASFVFLADDNTRFGELTLKIEVVESNDQTDEIAELEGLVKDAEAKANQNWSVTSCPLVGEDNTYSAVDYDEYLGFKVAYTTQCDESITTIVSAFFADNTVQSRMLESQFFSDANKEKSALKIVVRNDIYNIVTRNNIGSDLIKSTSKNLPSDVVNYLALHEQSWINYLKSENSDLKFTSFNSGAYEKSLVPEMNSARYMKQFCIEILKHTYFKCHMNALTHTENMFKGLFTQRSIELDETIREIFPTWTDETIKNYYWFLEGVELYKSGKQNEVQFIIQNVAYAFDSAGSIFTSTTEYSVGKAIEGAKYSVIKISNTVLGQAIDKMAKENIEFVKNSDIFIYIIENELTKRGQANAHLVALKVVENLKDGVDAWNGLDRGTQRTLASAFTIVTVVTPPTVISMKNIKKIIPSYTLKTGFYKIIKPTKLKVAKGGNYRVDAEDFRRSEYKEVYDITPEEGIASKVDLDKLANRTLSHKEKESFGENILNGIYSKRYDCLKIKVSYTRIGKGHGLDGLCIHGTLANPVRIDILEAKTHKNPYGDGVPFNKASGTNKAQLTDGWIIDVLERATGRVPGYKPDVGVNTENVEQVLELFKSRKEIFNKYAGVIHMSDSDIPIPVLSLLKVE